MGGMTIVFTPANGDGRALIMPTRYFVLLHDNSKDPADWEVISNTGSMLMPPAGGCVMLNSCGSTRCNTLCYGLSFPPLFAL